MSAVGLLSAGMLAACGTESDDVEPTVTREPAENAPSTNTPAPAGASPAAGTPASSASTPVPPSDGGVQPAGGGEASPPAVTGVQASPTSANVDFVDLAFQPAEITVAAGVDVTLNFANKGVLQHGYNIDAVGLESTLLNGGGTEQVVINVPAGTYDSYCPVPGHKEAGMVGKLIAQ